jgi:hypothetical protein
LPYFRVTTNNHLESFFGKVKDLLNPENSMAECLNELLAKERIRQNEFNYYTNRVGTYVNRNYDEEMSMVLRFTTHHVADAVAKEYDVGRSKSAEYKYVQADGVIKVIGATRESTVNTQTWRCTCDFASAMKLPCRHAVAARVNLHVKPVLPMDCIDLRYNPTCFR